MAFRFSSTSTQRFVNDTSFISVVPFTIGCWVRPSDVTGTKTVWCIANGGATNSYWRLDRNAGTSWQITAAAGGTANSASAGVPVANAWAFIIVRCITATNRRIHVLQTDTGVHANAQTTSTRSPTSLSVFAIGAFNGSTISQYWDGDIAEFWVCNADIWPAATALPEALFRNLAYRGPFCDARVTRYLTEYYAMRSAPSLRRASSTTRGGTEVNREVFYGSATSPNPSVVRVWDSLGGDNARMAPHPPMATHGRYVRRAQNPRVVMV